MDARHLLLAGALLGAVGCAGDPSDRPTEFHYLHATIIEPYCATVGCHSNATQQGVTMPLDLSTPDVAYEELTGRKCGTADPLTNPVTNYVCQDDADTPHAACDPSVHPSTCQGGQVCDTDTSTCRLCPGTKTAELTLRLEGLCCSDAYPRMPADEPLPDAEQKLIIDWVNQGAPCEP